MIADANKGIASISYNLLNLPVLVTKTNSDWVQYTYDAAGIKLKKEASISGNVTTTDYVGGKHYINNSLSFFSSGVGRIVKSGSDFNYEYNLSDHLGNVRVSLDTAGQVIQRDDYYPFGLTFQSYTGTNPKNQYGFQGQEYQEELGWHQYKWRNADPALGRFFNVDPLAEKYVYNSVYAFSENNVVAHVELEGLEKAHYSVKTGEVFNASDHFRYNPPIYATPTGKTSQEISEDMDRKFGELLSYTDVNDIKTISGAIAGNWTDIQGNETSGWDVGFATAGAFIPVVSGSAVKQFAKKGAKMFAEFTGIGNQVRKLNIFNFGKYGGDFFDNGDKIRKDLGVPEDWIMKKSDKDGGVRFLDPNNSANNLRVMPGRENSKFANSQKPYTIRYKNGSPVDASGNKIPNSSGKSQNTSSELHVPLEDFNFE